MFKANTEATSTTQAVQDSRTESLEPVGAKPQSVSHRAIEKGSLGKLAGRFPSDTFLWATLGSIALSASMKLSGRSAGANFVGEWAPTFLALGVFSKLVKIEKTLTKSAHA